MNRIKTFNFDLGIPHLISQWRNLFSTKYFNADLTAGITVACIAIPLSLAIALASGVTPAAGLVTAIIAGIVCALFGGAPLSISGPAAAMSVLIAATVEKFGIEGLVIIGLLTGIMQLLSGIFGLGKLGRYVPLPVIAGFTAGIGVIILIGQLPRAFGLLPPSESHAFDVFMHIKEYFSEINLTCLIIVITTIFIIRALPKIFPKAPSILIAVILTTAAVYFFHLQVPLIGAIPNTLPPPKLPHNTGIAYNELFLTAFTIFLLASLETLLSSSAMDKLTHEKKHDANQELIGQGLGNITVSFFGGIPVTSVIARSATNIRAGAKTRRASIFHSLIILLTVFAIAPVIGMIPIAALAGILFSVAFSMINYKEFRDLCAISPSEASIYAITFLTIIFVDLLAGVQAGIIAASLIVLVKAAKTHLHISTTTEDGIIRLSLTGSLTFLSTGEMDQLIKELEAAQPSQTVVLDLSSITNLDSSGAIAIIDAFNQCGEQNIKFYIKGLPRRFEALFRVWGGGVLLDKYYLISENDLKHKESNTTPKSYRGRLVHGVQRFYAETKFNDKRLFEFMAQKQDPHTLFITCSDSRVVPNLITSTDPGELFIIRNVGNVIPPYQLHHDSSEGAALEFALNYLDINDIVICGHSACGAIKTCCETSNTDILPPQLGAWIKQMQSQLDRDPKMGLNDTGRLNVLIQIENLKKYPIVQERISAGTLAIHGWFYDFDHHDVYEWHPQEQRFKSISLQKMLVE